MSEKSYTIEDLKKLKDVSCSNCGIIQHKAVKIDELPKEWICKNCGANLTTEQIIET